MATNLLKSIATRTKKIMRARGISYKAASKVAWAEYRSGKKVGSGKTKRPKKRRKMSGTLSGGARPSSYAIGKVKKRRRVSGTLSDSVRPSGYSIGKMSSAMRTAAIGALSSNQLMSRAKEKLVEKIQVLEGRKFKAVKKSMKNKIAKLISAAKTQYRKLC
jgi:hypothetical protein